MPLIDVLPSVQYKFLTNVEGVGDGGTRVGVGVGVGVFVGVGVGVLVLVGVGVGVRVGVLVGVGVAVLEVTVIVVVLFNGVASASSIEILAVFTMVPNALTFKRTVTYTGVLKAISDNAQVSTPPIGAGQVSLRDEVAETKVAPVGNVSVNITLKACDGPTLVIDKVKVNGSLGANKLRLAFCVICKSGAVMVLGVKVSKARPVAPFDNTGSSCRP